MASTGVRAPVRAPSRRFLPPDPRVEEPYRITPQLALRIGILGALTLVVFGVLFFRLWALQVLSGSEYLNAARNNQVRTVRVEAPRGSILDRHGRVLVSNAAGLAIQIWPADLPKVGRERKLRRLAALLNVPLSRIEEGIERRRRDPLTPVTLKQNATFREVAYLREHKSEFRGVTIARSYRRQYEHGALAAQLLGYVGEVSPEQLKRDKKKRYRPGDKIGQAGVEGAYDAYLRGRSGLARLRVDSRGRPRSRLTLHQQPRAGHAVRTTLDLNLQRAAEAALIEGIRRARATENGVYANGGALIALDPRDGAVLAMASNPTYEPKLYSNGRPAELAPLLDPVAAKRANYPGLNRAIAGLYPPGSTFKPVTALAAMQEGLLSPYGSLACTSTYEVHGQTFKNWMPWSEAMGVARALEVSCDTFFYQLGYSFYRLPEERGSPLQRWAREFGFGRTTGLDIGGEDEGLLPTPQWRRATFTKERYPDTWEIDRLWKSGDSVQLAIGQKDLLVTPLQMARFYALIANGGQLVTPHFLERVEQPRNRHSAAVVLRRYVPPAPRDSGVDPTALAVVRKGLYDGVHSGNGTSSGVFGNLPVAVAGKTGTAEKAVPLEGWPSPPLLDQSWWCGYGPYDRPEIVVCAVIENGGFGASAAAPAALKVFERYFGVKAGPQTYVPSD